MSYPRNVVIIGERGAVSQALQTELCGHPKLNVTVVATEAALLQATRPLLDAADLVVLCVQDFASPAIVAGLPRSLRILDISPSFRTNPDWVYGLPEVSGAGKISAAHRVANPGCFATAAILLLEPLLKAALLDPRAPLYLDAVGGYTTGGHALIEKAQANELAGECAYSLTRAHRHIDEIRHLAKVSGPLWFSPKIANFAQGIRMQIPLFDASADAVHAVLQARYQGTPVRVSAERPNKLPADSWAGQAGACIHVLPQDSGCLAVCLLDNMKKGAVDAARDNIHLMLELPLAKS